MYVFVYLYIYIYSIWKLLSHKLLGFSFFFFTPILPSVFGYISGAYIRNIKFSHWFHFFVSCNNNASHIHIWCQGHMLLNKKHYVGNNIWHHMWVWTTLVMLSNMWVWHQHYTIQFASMHQSCPLDKIDGQVWYTHRSTNGKVGHIPLYAHWITFFTFPWFVGCPSCK